MDQRAHMQHLTDIPEAWTRGKGARRHVGGHQSRGGPVGPTCQSADHHGWPSGPGPPPTSGLCRKLPISFLKSVLAATRRPSKCTHAIELPYKYEGGGFEMR